MRNRVGIGYTNPARVEHGYEGVNRMIDGSSMRRLAFIRYLYGEAVQQSRLPEPMCATSVLMFHDAAKLFLVLACEHKDVGKKTMSFLAYWEELNRKLSGDGLTQKKATARLNETRVGLKHHGNTPVGEAIPDYRFITTLFFEENTPTVFSVDFGDISLVALVQDWAVRSDLEEAEELRRRGEVQEAVGKVAVTFFRLIERRAGRDKLLSKVRWPSSTSPAAYKFGGSFGRAKLDYYSEKMFGELLEQIDALKKAVEPMQEPMAALALGVSYERYRQFVDLTPEVGMLLPKGDAYEGPVPAPLWGHRRPRYITPETYRFCFDFVVETALTMQSRGRA